MYHAALEKIENHYSLDQLAVVIHLTRRKYKLV